MERGCYVLVTREMGLNSRSRDLEPTNYPIYDGESNHAFYIDPKYSSTPSTMHIPAEGYYSYSPMQNSSAFKLVTNIKPDDVLSGRGGATNSHSGNRQFRRLVAKKKNQYLQAKKRDKPKVAETVVESIRSRGGRFLRRLNSRYHSGMVAWVDIGDVRAREKTCQALREGAPEFRKKRKASVVDETHPLDEGESTGSSLQGSIHSDVRHPSLSDAPGESGRKYDSDGVVPSPFVSIDGKETPIMIRPSFELTKYTFTEVISVDQLEPHDRVLYLRDFLPPDPAISRTISETAPPSHYIVGRDSYSCSFVEV